MAKSWGSVRQGAEETKADYYVYSDGHSYWGIPLYRNNETPIVCSADVHKKSTEEKITWYKESTTNEEEK